MSGLVTQTQNDFITQFLNAWAAVTGITPILGIGDPIEGIADATAANCIFLQYQSQYTTNFARLTTCTGPDVDSFLDQFPGFGGRKGAQEASGNVTLSVPLPASTQITIPIGTIIQTVSGSAQYQLVADTTQSAYNAALQAYVLAVGHTSITASVEALVAGSSSNVLANQLISFGTSSYGFTSVTNLAPIQDGADQESDTAVKNRFAEYMISLSKASYDAILEACQTTYPTFTYTILNNTNVAGAVVPGWFTVVANNPGETVNSMQLIALNAAVQAVRAYTVQSNVIAAIPVTPTINLNIAISSGDLPTIQAAVQTAIIGYVNLLPVGAKLYISNLIETAMNASSLISSVELSSVTINNVPTDYTPASQFTVVQANVNTVLIGSYSG